jgi:hypothetical protein
MKKLTPENKTAQLNNRVLKSLKVKFLEICESEDYLAQEELNAMLREWIKKENRKPKFGCEHVGKNKDFWINAIYEGEYMKRVEFKVEYTYGYCNYEKSVNYGLKCICTRFNINLCRKCEDYEKEILDVE